MRDITDVFCLCRVRQERRCIACICDTPYVYVGHDSFSDMTHFDVCGRSGAAQFACVTLRIFMCDFAYSYLFRDSFSDMTHFDVCVKSGAAQFASA